MSDLVQAALGIALIFGVGGLLITHSILDALGIAVIGVAFSGLCYWMYSDKPRK